MNPLSIAIVCILILALLEMPVFTVIAALSMACLFFVDHDLTAFQMILIEMNRLGSMPVLVALPPLQRIGPSLHPPLLHAHRLSSSGQG